MNNNWTPGTWEVIQQVHEFNEKEKKSLPGWVTESVHKERDHTDLTWLVPVPLCSVQALTVEHVKMSFHGILKVLHHCMVDDVCHILCWKIRDVISNVYVKSSINDTPSRKQEGKKKILHDIALQILGRCLNLPWQEQDTVIWHLFVTWPILHQ